MMHETVVCRFCDQPAVARFALPAGCAVYPNDREQDLCIQHVVNSEPIRGAVLVEVLDADGWAWFCATRRRWA